MGTITSKTHHQKINSVSHKPPPESTTLHERYYCSDFSLLCKKGEDYSSAFAGTTYKYTPNKIIFVCRTQNTPESVGSFWYPQSEGSVGSLKHDLAITSGAPMFNTMSTNVIMAIPKDIMYISGKAAAALLHTNTVHLPGGGTQIYIPLPVVKALWPLSQKFLCVPRSEASIQKFIEEAKEIVLLIQNQWWTEYSSQLQIRNEIGQYFTFRERCSESN